MHIIGIAVVLTLFAVLLFGSGELVHQTLRRLGYAFFALIVLIGAIVVIIGLAQSNGPMIIGGGLAASIPAFIIHGMRTGWQLNNLLPPPEPAAKAVVKPNPAAEDIARPEASRENSSGSS